MMTPWPSSQDSGSASEGAEPDAGSESVAELGRRAASGAALIAIRTVAIRMIAFGGGVALARMLQPRDFGTVALGSSLYAFIAFGSDAGLGAGLIRQLKDPSRDQLGAVVALQLMVATLATTLTIAVAWPRGDIGRVVAVMVAGVPLMAFRTPAVLVLERRLEYRRLVFVEFTEVAVYFAWAVTAVVMGFGVRGLASATLVQTVVGAVLMVAVSPVGLVLPKLSFQQTRRLLGFGAKFQAVSLVNLARDQGLNMGTAAIAGMSVLGLWSLANSILRLPFVVFDSLWRVSFPAMARLQGTTDEVKPILERILAICSLGAGCLLVPLVGAGPYWIGLVFGPQWAGSAAVLPWASLGLMLAGPISVACAGYLYSVGDASKVLQGAVSHTVSWLLIAFIFLPTLGVAALGIGWLAACIVEVVVLGTATAARSRANLFRPLSAQVGFSVLAAGIGWVVALSLRNRIAAPLAGGLLSEGLFLAAMLVVKCDLVLWSARLGISVLIPGPRLSH